MENWGSCPLEVIFLKSNSHRLVNVFDFTLLLVYLITLEEEMLLLVSVIPSQQSRLRGEKSNREAIYIRPC